MWDPFTPVEPFHAVFSVQKSDDEDKHVGDHCVMWHGN
jgi:hypothetical protein